MKSIPLVSIIIPCYNGGDLILEAVESVYNQNYKNFEIIIVDDGSTDDSTRSCFNELEGKDKLYLYRQVNKGPSIARNLAVEKSSGDFLVFLDADDLILKGTIGIALNYLIKDEKIGAIYGNYNCMGERCFLKKQKSFCLQKMLLYNQIAMCAIVRKNAFFSVEGFDTNLSKIGLEDWEFWIALYKAGWTFKYVPEEFFSVRIRSNSRTKTEVNKNVDSIRDYVMKKHLDLYMKAYEEMYHENKNIRSTKDFRIGTNLLKPLRLAKKLFSF